LLFIGFSSWWWVSPIVNSFLAMLIWGVIIVARAALPRMRYDCLIILT
jgi:NADH-ubiquinone oxidoreductase chain 1